MRPISTYQQEASAALVTVLGWPWMFTLSPVFLKVFLLRFAYEQSGPHKCRSVFQIQTLLSLYLLIGDYGKFQNKWK